MTPQTKLRICPLCEATCGLELTVEGRRVTAVRGDAKDAFSEGYICPKGVAIQDIDADSDRLRTPMIRRAGGWHAATWDEAFAEIERRLLPIIERDGRHAVGVYLGNPSVHNTGLAIYGQVLLRALGTPNVFSATTVDQMPKQVAVAALFGTGLSIPIPDLDRTQYLMILGANPLVSNGSLLTAPNIGERLKRIRQRGGKIVVIDPRKTETARASDEHHFIRPGTDAHFLFAIVHTLFEENLAKPGRLASLSAGLEDVRALAKAFSPEAVAEKCGIGASDIRRLARELAAAPSASVYARIGTCTQEFGTLASWLPEVIHVLTGNLDRAGGAMFTRPAYGPGNTKGAPGTGRGFRMGRHKSRVRELPEIFGELPVACLAEEIETPGPGQIRAMFTVAGNPVLSTPNGARLARALDTIEFMVSLDVYLNETSRHAHVILPGLSPLENCHYDMAFSQLAIRNAARFSPPVFAKPAGQPFEWETVLRLTGLVSGAGAKCDTAMLDDMVMLNLIERETKLESSPIAGRDAQQILAALAPRRGPERAIDFMLRTGPFGEGFGKDPQGLTLAKLEAAPHGIDLGPLEPRLPEVLRTPSGKIDLAPDFIAQDVRRLAASLGGNGHGLLLVGRRHLRSCNTWMHNTPRLVSGNPRCTLLMNPADAAALGLAEADTAAITSRAGTVQAPVELTEEMMPGVVSLPHGWGHDAPDTRLSVARDHAGVNSNLLTDEYHLDPLSGNAVLCGIPVSVKRAAKAREREAVAK
jgi:anaerobic selenocysteine-containing dehydrogenase